METNSVLSMRGIMASWPYDLPKYDNGPRDQQGEIFQFGTKHGCFTVEGPTGLGKGVVAFVLATALQRKLGGRVFWIVPTKALVQQFAEEFPEMVVAYGRDEYPCAWAAEDFEEEPRQPVTPDQLVQLSLDPQAVRVSDVATMVCKKCRHYVDPDSGATNVAGVVACPYYVQKHRVKHADRVLCTMSFYLFAHVFLPKRERKRGLPQALIIDEVHKLRKVVQYSLSYDITDWHLQQSIELLQRLGEETAHEVRVLRKFLRALKHIATARGRKAKIEVLLDDDEIRRLIDILDPIDTEALDRKIKTAVAHGVVRPKEDREAIKRLEVLVRDIRRYVRAFIYSTEWETEEGEARGPLNFTCSVYQTQRELVAKAEETGDKRRRKRVAHKLVIHASYVAPLIRKCLLAPYTVGLSATVGDADMFKFLNGIDFPLLRMGSDFPVENRRIYSPSDVPSLAHDAPASQRNKSRMLRQIVEQCRWFSDGRRGGYRTLVVVVSEAERQQFREKSERAGLDIVTYGNGVAAKDAASLFKEGEGAVLLGTSAHYAEGIDLPDEIAPVIFFLRPGYPNPKSPEQQFMVRRFGKRTTWKINRYEVMQQVNQTAGRNIRSEDDRGAIVLVDSRFRGFAFGALPKWLEPAYRRDLDWDACMEDVLALLKSS